MEIINILLSIAAIISMALAVAIGLRNGVKSLFFSAIMYILAIDYVLIVLRQSLAFNFYEFKFILLIPNVLLGVAAFLYTRIEISGSIKFKWYYILGLIAMVFFYSYLLINRADDNSPIYHVLKSAINFSAIFLALSNIDKELSNNRFGNINTVSNLKKNQRFLIALFLIVLTDISLMCLQKYDSINPYIYVSPVYLILTVYLGYNELFYKSSECNFVDLVSNDGECDEIEHIDVEDDYLSQNKMIISDQRVKEIVKLIERYVAKNRKFYINPEIKAKQIAANIGIKYPEFSYVLKNHYGLSFNNYINSLRVAEAEKLLRNNEEANHKIDTIGIMVGFKNKNSFHLAFKKFAGTTPSKYL